MRFLSTQIQPNKTSIPGVYPILDEKEILNCTVESLIRNQLIQNSFTIESNGITDLRIPPIEFIPAAPEPIIPFSWCPYAFDITSPYIGDPYSVGWSESLAINENGTLLAVAATRYDYNGSIIDGGIVRNFQLNGQTWVQKGSDITTLIPYVNLGSSLSFNDNGNILAIAGNGALGSSQTNGKAYVYEFISNNWIQKGNELVDKVIISSPRAGKISLNSAGNVVALTITDTPAATYVFQWGGLDWVLLGGMISRYNIGGNAFTLQADINGSGDTIIIGDQGNRGDLPSFPPYTPGVVMVKQWNGFAWVDKGTPFIGVGNYDALGSNVSIDSVGNRVAMVGGESVKIYDWNGSTWVQIGGDISITGVYDVQIELSDNGNRLVVTFPTEVSIAGYGYIKIFHLEDSQWVEKAFLPNDDATSGDLGSSIAFSGDGNHLAAGHNYYSSTQYVKSWEWHIDPCPSLIPLPLDPTLFIVSINTTLSSPDPGFF